MDDLDLVFKLAILGLLVGVVWWFYRHRYVFVVRIDAGKPRLAKGKVTYAFLQLVGEACSAVGINHGWVGGVYRGKRLALVFSRNIPAACRQRLRNTWPLVG